MGDDARPGGLRQDPHGAAPRERALEIAIGREVRVRRHQRRLTVAELAAAAGLSPGMLSKIENGLTSPSLTTLQTLAAALAVPLTQFFRRYEESRGASFVPSGEGLAIERAGTRAGHQYSLLGHVPGNSSGVTVEPYLITLTGASDVFPTFQHDGMEFLFMLEGEVVYRHAAAAYRLRPGDSLLFEADSPHGPEELTSLPARYLSVIAYRQNPD